MAMEDDVRARANGACELCGAPETQAAPLSVIDVAGAPAGAEGALAACGTCAAQLAGEAPFEADHWKPVTDAMWTPVPAVQGTAWRVLDRLKAEAWAAEALDMLYLDDETLAWAEAGRIAAPEAGVEHRDANGALLSNGDTVTLIKDLPVKGGGFTAKRGTAVRGISLVPDDPTHFSGRVNGQQIYIVCAYVKKSG
ncbi:alkylphosphonate utilization protein [Rhodovulum sp. DZ06]|uniref:alkylphosphonate utilization protein n=1 Tax=Rhodovulum sp. DZ06 TaxID=3425126 RepID=UPI003D34C7CA